MESFRNVEDASECQNLCQINEECFYWTYLKNGRCFLKNANALSTLATKKGPTSGPKICRKRPSINDVIHLGGGGFARRQHYSLSLFSKMGDRHLWIAP